MLGVLYMALFFGALIGAVIFIQKKLMKSKKFEKVIGLHSNVPGKENNKKQKPEDLLRTFGSCMGWFYWIAGLSLVNTLLILSHAGWSFMFGLTATQFLDYSWYNHFSEYILVDLILGIIMYIFILGSIALAGFLSKRKYLWAMWIGLIIVFLDGLLSFHVEYYWGAIFHVFIIIQIIRGYEALRRLHKDNKELPIKNQSGKQKLKFSTYLILNVVIVLFFWIFFLYDAKI